MDGVILHRVTDESKGIEGIVKGALVRSDPLKRVGTRNVPVFRAYLNVRENAGR
jgi:hypothetical protein